MYVLEEVKLKEGEVRKVLKDVNKPQEDRREQLCGAENMKAPGGWSWWTNSLRIAEEMEETGKAPEAILKGTR